MFALHALIALGAVFDCASGTVIRRAKDLPRGLTDRHGDSPCPSAPVVFKVLEYFSATQFCYSFLALTTKTITTTVPSLALTTTTTTTVQTDLSSITTTTTTPTTTTTRTTTTATAPASTSTDSRLTITTVPTTAVTVITTTVTTTSTTYVVDVENKKRSLAATAKADVGAYAKRNFKREELLGPEADRRLSRGCKCLVTPPTITVTSTSASTSVSVSTDTILSTSTTVVETVTAVTTSTNVLTTIETTTPITVITTFSTSTTRNTVATTTSTTTMTARQVQYIDIFAIPIELNGCTVESYNRKISNVGNSLDSSIDYCAPLCAMAGSTFCDDIFVQQNLPSGTWDCFLLSVAQEVNTNFRCNNPAVGQAAEVIIIY